MVTLLVFPVLFLVSRLVSGSTECDDFKYGTLCSLIPPSNILWVIPDLDSENKCQEECRQVSGCNNFTFERFSSGDFGCFLLRSCNTNSTSCTMDPDCSMAVSGPVSPMITDACCDTFSDTACNREFEISEIFDVHDEEVCQLLCRDELLCNYWTLFVDVCFLYTACDDPQPCSICTSGSAFPDISMCNSHGVLHTLLLGGVTSDASYSTTLETITPNVVCTPEMPPLPVARARASSVLLGSKIFYCGGENDESPAYHATCHSYLLGHGTNMWEQEPSMVYARRSFGMSLIGNTIYAIGGKGDYVTRANHATVESYTQEDGWKMEESMTMGAYRYDHCSAVLGTRLVVLGGFFGSSSASNSVQEFETYTNIGSTTTGPTGSWVSLQNMIAARYSHACQVGEFEGQAGIFVAGGYDSSVLSSVEFYVAAVDRWRTLDTMKTPRYFYSMTIVYGQMTVAGGVGHLTSVETLNGTNWMETNNLKVGRGDHAAISYPAGLLTCKADK